MSVKNFTKLLAEEMEIHEPAKKSRSMEELTTLDFDRIWKNVRNFLTNYSPVVILLLISLQISVIATYAMNQDFIFESFANAFSICVITSTIMLVIYYSIKYAWGIEFVGDHILLSRIFVSLSAMIFVFYVTFSALVFVGFIVANFFSVLLIAYIIWDYWDDIKKPKN
jgi:hypothetical protein